MSPCLDHRIRTAETLAAVSGLVLNMVLGTLIFSRGNKNLHAYNRVLALNCLVDMAFSVINYVVEMHADIRRGLIIVYNNGLYIGDLWTNFLQMCLYFYVIYLSIAIVAVPMIFRYFAICREHVLSTRQFVLLVVSVMIVPSSVPLSAILLWYTTSLRTLDEYAETINELGCYDKGQIVLFHASETKTAY
ncbi:hypothetical protein AAVH_22953 [Aphelenchoides avenae]|nr:hypothetical protein AAVH_22953 [Aphelenchus avenae]